MLPVSTPPTGVAQQKQNIKTKEVLAQGQQTWYENTLYCLKWVIKMLKNGTSRLLIIENIMEHVQVSLVN